MAELCADCSPERCLAEPELAEGEVFIRCWCWCHDPEPSKLPMIDSLIRTYRRIGGKRIENVKTELV